MQISPIPTLDDETNQIREMTAKIVAEDVIPNEHLLRRGMENAQLWSDLQRKVKQSGLWAPHLPEEYGGMGIGFLKLAYMNEILAWSPFSNPPEAEDTEWPTPTPLQATLEDRALLCMTSGLPSSGHALRVP